jgi:hypothetical protein
MRKFCILATVIALTAPPAIALDEGDLRTIGAYDLAAQICGSGPQHEESTKFACMVLDEAHRSLREAGLCYGKRGQMAYQAVWHKCGKGSLKPPAKITRQP